MSREVPFEPNAKCEACGALGAFDFMGDVLCMDCAFPKRKPKKTAADKQAPPSKGRGER